MNVTTIHLIFTYKSWFWFCPNYAFFISNFTWNSSEIHIYIWISRNIPVIISSKSFTTLYLTHETAIWLTNIKKTIFHMKISCAIQMGFTLTWIKYAYQQVCSPECVENDTKTFTIYITTMTCEHIHKFITFHLFFFSCMIFLYSRRVVQDCGLFWYNLCFWKYVQSRYDKYYEEAM